MNILYIGSAGTFSLIPFKKLLALAAQNFDIKLTAVGVYQPLMFNNTFKNKIIALETDALALTAQQANLPLIDLSQAEDDIAQQCVDFSVDVILMSCYNKRLPCSVINVASKGCYNMHPSLLPAYRGPEPIFWQMKQGDETGVSWHNVIYDFDAGDIVAQKKVHLLDGLTHSAISTQLAEVGANLMGELLTQISSAQVREIKQDSEQAGYYCYPQQSDFVINCHRDARQNYNFMCAAQAFGFAFLYRYKASLFYLKKAIDYENNQYLEVPEIQAGRIYIPCNAGVLIAEHTDKIAL